MTDRHEEALASAVGRSAERPTKVETGVEDLKSVLSATCDLGECLDAVPAGVREPYRSFERFFDALDAAGWPLGVRARVRLLNDHDLPAAAVVRAGSLLASGELDRPAGVFAYTFTMTTTERAGSPGVVAHPGGARTKTWKVASVPGGGPGNEYVLLAAAEPARRPLEADALAEECLELAGKVRAQLRALVENIGGLPLLGGEVRPALVEPGGDEIEGPRLMLGDCPAVVARAAADGLPFVMPAFVGPDGEPAAPEGVFLDLTPLAPADAERPGRPSGAIVLLRTHIAERLLQRQRVTDTQLFQPVPTDVGVARCTKGGVMVPAPGGCTLALSAVTFNDRPGPGSIALTNITPDEAGLKRMGLAVEGLFSAPERRMMCRDRAGEFLRMFVISTTTPDGGRRVGALATMTFAPTVPQRAVAL